MFSKLSHLLTIFSRKLSIIEMVISTRRLEHDRIEHALPPRSLHRRTFPIIYREKEILVSEAVSVLECLLEANGGSSLQCVNYAMVSLINLLSSMGLRITERDEQYDIVG